MNIAWQGRKTRYVREMQEFTDIVSSGRDLTASEAEAAAKAMLDTEIPDALRADFLRKLSAKVESSVEIEAFARVFLDHAVDPKIDPARLQGPMLDIVGTGGDRLNLFNVSTTSMFVLAGGGVSVVKHGNRAVTSKSGGADVLEALGVRIDLPPDRLAETVESIGLGFLFAPLYHPAFKAVVPVRKMLADEGVRTIFNLLGPLLNPARPEHQLIGVAAGWLGPLFSHQMERLGRKKAWVVHGLTQDEQSMDELSILGPTQTWQWDGENHTTATLYPWNFDLDGASLEELQGADAATNAATTIGILDGTLRDARRRMVAYNAAAGFVACGMHPTIEAGLSAARESIDSGAALAKLKALAAIS